MATIALLCEILATQVPKTLARDLRGRSGYSDLIRLGILEERGIVQSVLCDECDAPHDSAIIHEGGQYGFHCPDLGFVVQERSTLSAVQPNNQAIISHVADAFGCRRRRTSPLANGFWRVGSTNIAAGDVTIYFCQRLRDASDLNACQSALQTEVKGRFGLILSAAGRLPMQGFKTVLLNDAVEIDTPSGALRPLTSVQALADAPIVRKGGRPAIYSVALGHLIADRAKTGVALEGRNEEAKALTIAFRERYPNEVPPPLSTAKRYLTKFRGGS